MSTLNLFWKMRQLRFKFRRLNFHFIYSWVTLAHRVTGQVQKVDQFKQYFLIKAALNRLLISLLLLSFFWPWKICALDHVFCRFFCIGNLFVCFFPTEGCLFSEKKFFFVGVTIILAGLSYTCTKIFIQIGAKLWEELRNRQTHRYALKYDNLRLTLPIKRASIYFWL